MASSDLTHKEEKQKLQSCKLKNMLQNSKRIKTSFLGYCSYTDVNETRQKHFAEPVLKVSGHHDTVTRLLSCIDLLGLPPPTKAADGQH